MHQSKNLVIVILLFCVLLIYAQDDDGCQPGLVRNINLYGNNTLSWDPPLAETCEILHYLVRITVINSNEEWVYTVTELNLDVGHLTPCLRHYFYVSQVSTDNITGTAARMDNITPPPSEANLALEYFTVTKSGRDVRLQWSLERQWVLCAQRYRLVIANEDNGRVQDIYMASSSSTVVGLISCATYTFTVRALFTLEEEGPPSMVRHIAEGANTTVPTIQNVTVGSTNVALVLGLQSVAQNWCQIQSVNIDASPFFESTFPVVDQESRETFKANLINLQPDMLYTLRISATNSVGTTGPLLLAVQTLGST